MTAEHSPAGEHDSHGQSFTSWLVVILLIVASIVMTLAVWWADWVMFTGGAVMVPLALVVGALLHAVRGRRQAPGTPAAGD